MNEALLEGVLQTLRGLPDVVHRVRHRYRADLADQPQEVHARNVFHRHVGERAIEIGLVNRDDVLVIEQAGRLDLGIEPFAGAGTFELGRIDGLERHDPVHGDLPGLVDDAHAAAVDLLHHLKAGDDTGGGGRGSPRGGS